ncbi:MAG: response regulator [Deltaproteobacteria bacterium]|nr:MAG: response regulator [Deltaproteobacteria bacterium]
MRVLLIDDHPQILRIAQMALERVGGFDVHLAEDAAEGIALAQRIQPDLIVLDVMMPGMDGLTALAHLQGLPATCTTPVAFMTARVRDEEVASYLAAGAIGIVRKPFDAMRLAEDLSALLASSR